MTTIKRLRELERAAKRTGRSTIASALDEHAYDKAVHAALPAMLAVIEAAEALREAMVPTQGTFAERYKAASYDVGRLTNAMAALDTALAAFREVRE